MAYLAGIDVGSTTVKMVVIDHENQPLFTKYERHFSDIFKMVRKVLKDAQESLAPDVKFALTITGSGGMGLAEALGVPFVQEVIACTKTIETIIPETDVAIELGGEDAKITFLGATLEQRMNGSCAGGTGAFIDQMAALLETDANGLNELAKGRENIFSIASRCGVFAKTDVQPLINEGATREDIAASIFQAVVNQTITALAAGRKIKGRVAFLGGPLYFMSELRKRFIETLELAPEDVIFPKNSQLFVAFGAALFAKASQTIGFSDLLDKLTLTRKKVLSSINFLPRLFNSTEELADFRTRHAKASVGERNLSTYQGRAFLGIDAGSTTNKVILLSTNHEILFSYYGNNEGQPLENLIAILRDLYQKKPSNVYIANSCVTGYGENLLKNSLKIDLGEVETIAHYKSANFFYPGVDFILDIGGQDMKALRVEAGVLTSIQLNEACSSGCGSFIEGFAKSLKISVENFAQVALLAENPVDLGSRCTVFMNSKVKQVQKEGVSIGDISAGLSYSVIKNVLYKVIKMHKAGNLGKKIVVQGGTFYNEAILRAFEKIAQKKVVRPQIAGLMGAFGAALIACERSCEEQKSTILKEDELAALKISKKFIRCGKCANNCQLTLLNFSGNRNFVMGNRCERGAVHLTKNSEKSNSDAAKKNLYDYKHRRLFSKYQPLKKSTAYRGLIGIPRVLNIWENYPLWFTLFTELGFRVVLSPRSTKELYFKGMDTISSDTVCFPAKIVHGHIKALINLGLPRIFYPSVIFEQIEDEQAANHFNCPVVQSYPEVIRNNVDEIIDKKFDYHQPFLNLANEKSVANQLFKEFSELKISKSEIKSALTKAYTELADFKQEIKVQGEVLLREIIAKNERGIVLVGRPYHLDPEINHGISEFIAKEGFHVLTEDSIAHLGAVGSLRVVNQWVYHARAYAAARVVGKFKNLELVQLNSFGCGIDAVTTDQVEEIMKSYGKIYTVLKIDEGDNLSSIKIRLRSLKAAVLEREKQNFVQKNEPTTSPERIFIKKMKKNHTILMPVLSPIHQFGLLDEVFKSEGYQVVVLPAIDKSAIDIGLQYVNNDACYPAIIVIGQLIKALQSGQYDLFETTVMMTQTGGGCRATNYLALLKKALRDADFKQIPVISLSFGNKGVEKTKGFKFTLSLLKKAVVAVLFGDLLKRVVYRMRPYELIQGEVDKLSEIWLKKIKPNLWSGSFREFRKNMRNLINDFDRVPLRNEKKVKVGLVGEILVKYAPTANNDIVRLLEAEGVEVVVPDLMGFLKYSLYNQIWKQQNLGMSRLSGNLSKLEIKLIEKIEKPMDKALRASTHFSGIKSIFEIAEGAREILSIGNHTGEGWLLTGEMIEFLKENVNNIICVQPFGCLPNHVVGKGVFKELRRQFPEANVTAIDYDPGVSFLNQLNRIRLMLARAKEKLN